MPHITHLDIYFRISISNLGIKGKTDGPWPSCLARRARRWALLHLAFPPLMLKERGSGKLG